MHKSTFILYLLLGFFMMSVNSYACEKHAKMNQPKTESTSSASKKGCCSEKSGDKKACDGKCGHSGCTCTSGCSSFSSTKVSYLFTPFSAVDFSFHTLVKTNHNTPSLSDGFSSIWLIPKIG